MFTHANAVKKVITISACGDGTVDLHERDCSARLKTEYDALGIDHYAINIPAASDARNTITLENALTNLRCLSDSRVCVTMDAVDSNDFMYVVDDCLVPHICSVPTVSPTIRPTGQPTLGPSSVPSLEPTKG